MFLTRLQNLSDAHIHQIQWIVFEEYVLAWSYSLNFWSIVIWSMRGKLRVWRIRILYNISMNKNINMALQENRFFQRDPFSQKKTKKTIVAKISWCREKKFVVAAFEKKRMRHSVIMNQTSKVRIKSDASQRFFRSTVN